MCIRDSLHPTLSPPTNSAGMVAAGVEAGGCVPTGEQEPSIAVQAPGVLVHVTIVVDTGLPAAPLGVQLVSGATVGVAAYVQVVAVLTCVVPNAVSPVWVGVVLHESTVVVLVTVDVVKEPGTQSTGVRTV